MAPMVLINPYILGGAAAWTPAELTTALWLDAADSSTITESGGAVSQWDDKSGNDNHATQGTGTNQPSTGTRTIGGLNTFNFDGSNDVLVVGATSDFEDKAWTVFAVAQHDELASINVLHRHSYSGSQTMWGCFTESGDIYGHARDSGANFVGIDFVGDTSPVLTTFTWRNDDTIEFWANGTSKGTLAGADATTNTHINSFIGANNASGSSSLDGAIGEMVFVPSELSDTDRQKVEGYLAHKWGLVDNLPVGHPYKTSPPKV